MQRLLLITIMLAVGIMATGFGQGPFDSPSIRSTQGEEGELGLGPPPPLPQTNPGAKGKIEIINPPGNNGSTPGAGLINPKNASGELTGPPFHVFQTPADVVAGQVLSEGLDVDYVLGTGNQATQVQRDF